MLTHNRPTMCKDTIESLVALTDINTYELIICDNSSTQLEMIKLLKELETKFVVLRNIENKLFEGLNVGLNYIKNNDIPYFIITDPDIVLNASIPNDWILKMSEILDKTQYPKIGLALDINFEKETEYTNYIKYGQHSFWKNKVELDFVEDDCYEGLVDTTMAMYRKDTFSYWKNDNLIFDRNHGIEGGGWISLFQFNEQYKDIPLRIAGRFTAKHIGWWLDKKHLIDFPFYIEHSLCNQISSSFQDVYLDKLFKSMSHEDFTFLFSLLSPFYQEKLKRYCDINR